jgi:DNA-binding Xre family transcriptional regulator
VNTLQDQWRELHAQIALAEASAMICGLMLRAKVNKRQLAELLDVTEKAVDTLLSGSADTLTLRSLSNIAYLLGASVHIQDRARVGDGPPIVRVPREKEAQPQ